MFAIKEELDAVASAITIKDAVSKFEGLVEIGEDRDEGGLAGGTVFQAASL